MLIRHLPFAGCSSLSEERCRRLAQTCVEVGLALLLVLSEVFSSNIQSTLPALSSIARLGADRAGRTAAVCQMPAAHPVRDPRAVGGAVSGAGLHRIFHGVRRRRMVCAGGADRAGRQGCGSAASGAGVSGGGGGRAGAGAAAASADPRWCPSNFTAATGITGTATTTDTVPGWWGCSWPGPGCAGRGCAGWTGWG